MTDKQEHDGHVHVHGDCCDHSASDALGALPGAQVVAGKRRTPIRILQMDCPTEEALIRKKLRGMQDVSGVEFNLMQRMLTVEHVPAALSAVLDAIRSLGFEPELAPAERRLPAPVNRQSGQGWALALAGTAAFSAELADWFTTLAWAPALLALSAVGLSGIGTYKKGLTALFNGVLNINALMSIAVTGALALGQWPEAAMVMVLFAIAEFIEARSLEHARGAIDKLMQLAPDTVVAQDAHGAWTEMAAEDVQLGMRIQVRPGGRIGLDGRVVRGASVLDQSSITGESIPVEKTMGDPVYAGSINGLAEIEYIVEAAHDNTLIARMVQAVQQAQASKAPTQRFVDRFARIYTPVVCLLALGVALAPPLLLGLPWFDWIYRALVLLVIACPCALVISTPVAIVSGLAAAARHGILIKGGVYLESGRKLTWIAFDKTGTLTHGKPRQTGMIALTSDHDDASLRRLAASLAERSDHPVAQAIASFSRTPDLLSVEDVQAVPGGGVRGRIDGADSLLGAYRWVKDQLPAQPAVAEQVHALQAQGQTVTVLAVGGRALALFAVADAIKPCSREAIRQLHDLGLHTAMLSGDNQQVAQAIAAQAGIDDVRAELLPQDKLDAIDHYETDGVVGMVGDGINDAPALARADIGFVMGAMGADVAMHTADVALMDDDLRKIPRFVRLSRATYAILVQNIALALGIKLVFLVLTLVGMGTMWMAVFADVGASLLVLGNSLRLLKK